MNRACATFAITLGMATLSCANLPLPQGISDVPASVPSVSGQGIAIHGPGDDQHWIQADDYWISDRPYESGWIYLTLAKMKQPPAAQTKGEALFFNLHDSKDVWTKYFYRTRVANQADLAVGSVILCFEGNSRDGTYHAPMDKNQARTAAWFMGRITDMSDLYKGSLMVDTYHCAPDALRAFVR
ncbi:MAG TPA: hypothetical protein VMK12_03435 [Anaeromyxobacteraceae bacterium]|nr:hypothetical protein [Anaeromyxobacteraceae bacterium]